MVEKPHFNKMFKYSKMKKNSGLNYYLNAFKIVKMF